MMNLDEQQGEWKLEGPGPFNSPQFNREIESQCWWCWPGVER